MIHLEVRLAQREPAGLDSLATHRRMRRGILMASSVPSADAAAERSDGADLGPLPGFLRPFVDVVARAPAKVHTKLLAGFLLIAMLLLSMGVVSVVVLYRINDQVGKLTALS